MRKLFFSIFVLGFSINLLASVSPVHACTGSPYSIRHQLEIADIVIKAEVIEIGTRGQNAILKVDSYLYGNGPEYIVNTRLHRDEAQYIESAIFGGGFCDSFQKSFEIGQQFYVILSRELWGNYTVINSFNEDYYDFPTSQAILEIAVDEYWEEDAYHPTMIYEEMNETEFVALIGEYTGEIPHPPEANSLYPQSGLLKINTVHNSSYILPIDSNLVIQFSEFEDYESDSILNPSHSQIMVYPFASINNRFLSVVRPLGDPVIHVKLQDFETLTEPLHVWNDNRQLLAYSDGAGLWLVNLFGEATTPQLIYSAQNGVIPYARYFSPQSRYLAIEMGDRVFNFDLLTHQELPAGVFSPNETLLLAYETNHDLTALKICLPYACRETDFEIKDAVWKDSTWYFAVVCDYGGCFVEMLHNQWSPVYVSRRIQLGQGYGFAYEPYSETLAIVSDTSTITIGNQVYELAGQLDGDIASIEWVTSLLYWDQ